MVKKFSDNQEFCDHIEKLQIKAMAKRTQSSYKKKLAETKSTKIAYFEAKVPKDVIYDSFMETQRLPNETMADFVSQCHSLIKRSKPNCDILHSLPNNIESVMAAFKVDALKTFTTRCQAKITMLLLLSNAWILQKEALGFGIFGVSEPLPNEERILLKMWLIQAHDTRIQRERDMQELKCPDPYNPDIKNNFVSSYSSSVDRMNPFIDITILSSNKIVQTLVNTGTCVSIIKKKSVLENHILVARQSKLSEKRQLYFSLNGLTYNWNFVVLDNWNFHCIIEFDFIRDNHIIIDQNSNKMLLPNGQYRPYKIPNVQQCIMESLIKDLLTDNIIRESSSLWYSPALLKQKKDGSNRIDQYSLPLIEELVDRLAGSKVFSIPDLISGFWQWAMNESHNEKTAFCP
ncbi:hypothetical protein RF11_07673 [Thelohanellus kitauei]|uniref:Reverse transcriptase domain-containing protein n=1 Tax=Thelohanellus kitauei TaxID=669202 RepID=A0A0C2JDS9_THEKT|nr:hypothetical protein RF11_07673 [Thelohanellus kitauei]